MDVLVYLLCFILIWRGADLIVSSVTKLAHKLKISTFSVSFFVLGTLTSIPEIMVGINSVIGREPEIFVGNLLGGTMVLFIFVIPLLAVLGNGLSLKHELNNKHLLSALLVILAPAFLVIDNTVTLVDGIILISLYAVLFYILERSQTVKTFPKRHNFHWAIDVIKILIGTSLVIISSSILVDKTVYFAQIFGLSPFIISFIVVAIGTNLPELVLASRAVISGHKDVAFGDFLGSAVANSLIMGFLVLINQTDIIIPVNFIMEFIFIFGGIALFYYFSRSHQNITRREGAVLLCLYSLFIIIQVFSNR